MQMKEKLFRKLFEKSPNAIAYQQVLRNETGQACDALLIASNLQLAELFHAAPEEIIGKRLSEIYPIQDEKTERYIALLGEAAASGQEITFNIYVRLFKKWLRISLFAVEADCVAAVCVDITKEVLQEQEIEGFLKANLDMLCVADKNGCFIKANKEFEDVLGYRGEELSGQSFFSLVHAEDRETLDDVMRQFAAQAAVADGVNRCRCKNGSYKYIEWRYQAIGRYIYASARDVSENIRRRLELQETNELLKRQAITDKLTGVYNRHYFEQRLQDELERADRYDEPLAMIILDMDHFKRVNDTWGHPVGDEVLKQTAENVGRVSRASDLLARLGGEEFALVMPQTTLEGALQAAEKIRRIMEEFEHTAAGRVTASFGVAQRMKGESFKNWYQRADSALYRAKNSGRNRVVACSAPDLAPLASVHLDWRSSWECGQEEIDAQHRQMLELANDLLNENGPEVSPDRLLPPLNRLLEHIREHFTSEEEILNALHYPQTAEHQQLHRKLLLKAIQLKDGYNKGEIRPSAFFSFLMDDLIMDHMLKEDVRFFLMSANSLKA